jgi:uncharacterized repeat protein (TIGR03833 family)
MNEIKRVDLKTGMRVKVIMKEGQRTRKLTAGIVKDILTCLAGRQAGKISKTPSRNKSANWPKDSFGETGEVGRVKEILE